MRDFDSGSKATSTPESPAASAPAMSRTQRAPLQIQVWLTPTPPGGGVTSTISFRDASHAIADPPPPGGPPFPRSSSCQVLPSHAQVSSAFGPAWSVPPNRSTSPICGSKAADAPYRPGGLSAGCATAHAVPSQSHVVLKSSTPPKSTSCRVARSAATLNPKATAGWLATGVVAPAGVDELDR